MKISCDEVTFNRFNFAVVTKYDMWYRGSETVAEQRHLHIHTV